MRPRGQFLPTPAQLLAARAAVGLSVQALAQASGLGVNTIRRAEAGGAAVLTTVNAERLIATLNGLGVVFLEPDEDGPGLRFRESGGPERSGPLS